MEKFIVGLDQGTTSSRAVVFNKKVEKIATAQREFQQYFPKPGWVEHNPEDILISQLSVMKEAVMKADLSPDQIEAVGITNQRETVILWDKNTGKPVYNAIVWQCRRTADIADKLIADGKGEMIRQKTGLIPDAYFSGTKIKWILDNVSGARERAEKGELLAGTVDTWLTWRLSGRKAHVTDYTNACRTMLYNIHTLEWDDELLALLNIPRCILPEVKDSSCVYAMTDKSICGFEAPIASMIGDQQAALFGQACVNKGDVKSTYGTGCFMLMNTGDTPVESKHKLLTTIAIGLNGKVEYALEGSVFIGGALIKWLRDQLGIINTANDVNVLAATVPDSNGVIIVPAFTGLGAPYWDSYARGTIVGLTRGANKAHICRAALEAIAFQVKDELDCMKEDSGIEITSLKVDGGACVSDLMMQFQADILNTAVYRPENTETTVTGAALLAGLATGYWSSKDELKKIWKINAIFEPNMDQETRTARYDQWINAVKRTMSKGE